MHEKDGRVEARGVVLIEGALHHEGIRLSTIEKGTGVVALHEVELSHVVAGEKQRAALYGVVYGGESARLFQLYGDADGVQSGKPLEMHARDVVHLQRADTRLERLYLGVLPGAGRLERGYLAVLLGRV